MHCIFCDYPKTKVTHTRIDGYAHAKYNDFIRSRAERRRECVKCNRRFTTIEIVYEVEKTRAHWGATYNSATHTHAEHTTNKSSISKDSG